MKMQTQLAMRELTLDEIEGVSGGWICGGYGGDDPWGSWGWGAPWLTASTFDHSFLGGGGGGGGGFFAALGSFFHAAGDFLGFDGRFGYQGGGGSFSFGNLGNAFTSGFIAAGDFLGFDGQFGYQGRPDLAGPNAFFAPPLLDAYLEPLPDLLDAMIPLVHLYPFEVNLQAMNSQAAQIGTQIGSQINEYAGIIYYDTQGTLHASSLFTQNSPTSVGWDPTTLPPGSTIVAIIHNHPSGPAAPSSSFTSSAAGGGDWESLFRLIGTDYTPWGVNISPFATQYIVDNNSNTYVYFLDQAPGDAAEGRQLGELVR